jgi:hypothetical protein
MYTRATHCNGFRHSVHSPLAVRLKCYECVRPFACQQASQKIEHGKCCWLEGMPNTQRECRVVGRVVKIDQIRYERPKQEMSLGKYIERICKIMVTNMKYVVILYRHTYIMLNTMVQVVIVGIYRSNMELYMVDWCYWVEVYRHAYTSLTLGTLIQTCKHCRLYIFN